MTTTPTPDDQGDNMTDELTPKPIETHYAGCRFRSRLEARWAVFFDKLGIKWEYEPQGYVVGKQKRPYLPDFLLPELKTFVEVKGDASRLDLGLLAEAACASGDLHFTLILGPVPVYEVGKVPSHSWLTPVWDFRYPGGPWNDDLPMEDRNEMYSAASGNEAIHRALTHMTRETFIVQPIVFIKGSGGAAVPIPAGGTNLAPSATNVLEPGPAWWVVPDPAIKAAYDAARSARFEHGESP